MKRIIKFGNGRRRIGVCICGTEFYFDNEDMKNGEVSCPVCGKNVRVKRDEGEKIEVWMKKCVYCGKEFEYTSHSTKKKLFSYADRHGIPRNEETEWAECPKCGFPNMGLYAGERREVLLD